MEGYIGGGLLTVILGVAFTQFCVIYGYPSLICPAESNESFLSNLLKNNENDLSYQSLLYTSECKIPDVFRPQNYQVSFLDLKATNSHEMYYFHDIVYV